MEGKVCDGLMGNLGKFLEFWKRLKGNWDLLIEFWVKKKKKMRMKKVNDESWWMKRQNREGIWRWEMILGGKKSKTEVAGGGKVLKRWIDILKQHNPTITQSYLESSSSGYLDQWPHQLNFPQNNSLFLCHLSSFSIADMCVCFNECRLSINS